MSLYNASSDPPLKFHKFFHYCSLPLGALVTIINVYNVISGMAEFNWFYIIDYSYFFCWFVLAVATFAGFFGFKRYSWYTVMIFLTLTPVYALSSVLVYAVYVPDSAAFALGQFIGYSVYSVLVIIYYSKRKKLFFKEANREGAVIAGFAGKASSREMSSAAGGSGGVPQWEPYRDLDKMFIGSAKPSPAQVQGSEESVRCGRCGSMQRPGGQYCSRCGSRMG